MNACVKFYGLTCQPGLIMSRIMNGQSHTHTIVMCHFLKVMDSYECAIYGA